MARLVKTDMKRSDLPALEVATDILEGYGDEYDAVVVILRKKDGRREWASLHTGEASVKARIDLVAEGKDAIETLVDALMKFLFQDISGSNR